MGVGGEVRFMGGKNKGGRGDGWWGLGVVKTGRARH